MIVCGQLLDCRLQAQRKCWDESASMLPQNASSQQLYDTRDYNGAIAALEKLWLAETCLIALSRKRSSRNFSTP